MSVDRDECECGNCKFDATCEVCSPAARFSLASDAFTRGAACKKVGLSDDPDRCPTMFGCSSGKFFEICIASSIHTVAWAALLFWTELFFQTYSVGQENMMDTVFAFAFVWIATFTCFYMLVEDDEP